MSTRNTPGHVMVADLPPRDPAASSGNGTDPSVGSSKRNGVVIADLGREVKERLGLALGHDGRLWRYADGVYLPDGRQQAERLARDLLGARFAGKHLDDMMRWLKADEAVITGEPQPDVLNVANGMLDWRTGELRPHDPMYRSVWRVPVRWTSAPGDGEVVLRFLEQVMPADAVPFALELLGYCIFPGNPYRKAVLLLGSGRNGKSTFLSLARALIGPAHCAAIPLQTMAESRFAAADLYGMAANIAGDLDARAIKRTDLFKCITGGDDIAAERKYGHPFTFRSWALPLFSANEAPFSSDQTDGWFDRWIVVPFERRFAEHEADPTLLDRLTAPAEMEALLHLAVDALARLMDRGRFDPPSSIRAAGDAYRERLDTVRAFVAEHCEWNPDGRLRRNEVRSRYVDWARECGRLPVSAPTFLEHLARMAAELGHPLKDTKYAGQRGWKGIQWSAD